MKTCLLLMSGVMLFGGVPPDATQDKKEASQKPSVLTGTVDRDALTTEPYRAWFTAEYEAYGVNDSLLDSLKELLDGVAVDIFMGTWCSDSRRDVPRFYRILDHLGLPGEQVRLVGVDSAKTSPGHEEEGMNIHHVPTFIFYLDGVEIGRIIEFPVLTLEEDIYAILTGEVYLPNYHELE